MSLNPVVHIDPIGTLLFPLIAMFTNLPLIGWAKPVPVNPSNLHGHWKRKYMMIAAAGPGQQSRPRGHRRNRCPHNRLRRRNEPATSQIFQFLLMMVVLNVLLAVFNMLPVRRSTAGTC